MDDEPFNTKASQPVKLPEPLGDQSMGQGEKDPFGFDDFDDLPIKPKPSDEDADSYPGQFSQQVSLN